MYVIKISFFIPKSAKTGELDIKYAIGILKGVKNGKKNETAVKLCIKFSVVCLGNNNHKCYVLYFNYVFVGTEWVS